MSDHTPRKGRLTAHSPRELDTWARCPRLWWWMYPMEGRHTLPSTSAARRGIALHEAIAAGIAAGSHGDHPVVAAALEYLGGRSAATEGQYESGLLMGRVDALVGSEVIDWKTIETDDGVPSHSGRLPGIQGEVYCRLTGTEIATVVEIDEFGDWEATSAKVGDAAWALFCALVGVEWGWEAHQRGEVPPGCAGRYCLDCPAAAGCTKGTIMTTRELFESLPEETRAHILRALAVGSYEEAETRYAKALPSIIEAQAAAPPPAAKKTKKAAEPTPEPEPTPAPAAPVPNAKIVAALVSRLTTVPREQWPALSPIVLDAVADGVAAARRASWRSASTAQRVELLLGGVVPASEGNLGAVIGAEDITVEQLALLADLTLAPF